MLTPGTRPRLGLSGIVTARSHRPGNQGSRHVMFSPHTNQVFTWYHEDGSLRTFRRMEEVFMKGSTPTDSHGTHDSAPNSHRSPPPRRSVRRPYQKPRVEPAGSVFSRTKAIGSGAKDLLVGSLLL